MARAVHIHLPRGYGFDRKFNFDLEAGEKWITLHPNGRREKGVPVLVSGTKGNYTIKGGAGGKFTGQKVGEITKAGKEEAKVKAEEKKTPAFQGLLSQIKQKGTEPPPAPKQEEPKLDKTKEPAGSANSSYYNGGASALKQYFKEMIEYTGAKTLKEAYNKIPESHLSMQKQYIKNVLNGSEEEPPVEKWKIPANWAKELADKTAANITEEPKEEPKPEPKKSYSWFNLPPQGSPEAEEFIESQSKSLGVNKKDIRETLEKAYQLPLSKLSSASANEPKPSYMPPKDLTTTSGPKAAEYHSQFSKAKKATQQSKPLTKTQMTKLAKFIPTAKPETWNDMPGEDRYAIRSYTNGGYDNVNEEVRNPGSKKSQVLAQQVAYIKRAFKSPLAKNSEDFVTYRSYTMPDDEFLKFKEKLANGEHPTFTQQGFMSTTFRKNFADNWSGNTTLEILVRKETPALAVKSISHHSNEDEVLLNHGQEFELVDITEGYGHKRTIRLVSKG